MNNRIKDFLDNIKAKGATHNDVWILEPNEDMDADVYVKKVFEVLVDGQYELSNHNMIHQYFNRLVNQVMEDNRVKRTVPTEHQLVQWFEEQVKTRTIIATVQNHLMTENSGFLVRFDIGQHSVRYTLSASEIEDALKFRKEKTFRPHPVKEPVEREILVAVPDTKSDEITVPTEAQVLLWLQRHNTGSPADIERLLHYSVEPYGIKVRTAVSFGQSEYFTIKPEIFPDIIKHYNERVAIPTQPEVLLWLQRNNEPEHVGSPSDITTIDTINLRADGDLEFCIRFANGHQQLGGLEKIRFAEVISYARAQRSANPVPDASDLLIWEQANAKPSSNTIEEVNELMVDAYGNLEYVVHFKGGGKAPVFLDKDDFAQVHACVDKMVDRAQSQSEEYPQ